MDNLNAVLSHYGLHQPTIHKLSSAGKNNRLVRIGTGKQDLILKHYASPVYNDKASIDYELHILQWLSQKLPSIRFPLPNRTVSGDYIAIVDGQRYSLIPHFSGFAPDPHHPDHMRWMGAVMGQLQSTLAQHPIVERPGRSPFIQFFNYPAIDIFNLKATDLQHTNSNELRRLLDWWQDEANKLKAFHAGDYQSLPSQINHNDFTLANTLVSADGVHAVLDFEFMAVTARAFDLSTALRMIMRTWEDSAPWDRLKWFFRGYRGYIHLTEPEIEALPLLIRLRASMSTLWWLGRQQQLDRVPQLMTYHANLTNWLSDHGVEFIDRVNAYSH